MKATSLFIPCALLFTVLTSEKGCQDQSATSGGKTGTTTNGSSHHSAKVPINGTIGLLLAAGLGLGAITIIKRNRRNIASQ